MNTFDEQWENIYSSGNHLNRYPWDQIVSFLYRYYPKDKNRINTKILEVGCGTGNNLWFAAREGFTVYGIDGSKAAIEYAKKRFTDENLSANLFVGDFTKLNYPDYTFDIILDRAALTHTDFNSIKTTIDEIHRTLNKDGLFYFCPFGDSHSSAIGAIINEENRVWTDIVNGSLIGVGQVCFISLNDIYTLLPSKKWHIESIRRVENIEFGKAQQDIQSEWRIIARKIGS